MFTAIDFIVSAIGKKRMAKISSWLEIDGSFYGLDLMSPRSYCVKILDNMWLRRNS
jgi:hypothetical protein